jgi:hypothetical protein
MSILVRHNKMQVDQPPHFVSVHGWTNSYAITYTGVLHVYSVVLIDDIYIRTSFEILAKFVQECTSRSRRCCTGMDTATPASSSLEQDMSTLKTKTRPHDAYWWKNSIKLRTTFQLGVGRNWDLWIYNLKKKYGSREDIFVLDKSKCTINDCLDHTKPNTVMYYHSIRSL